MKQIVLRFGLLAVCFALLLQLGQYSLVTRRFSEEWMLGLFAMIFIGFGFAISRWIKTRQELKETSISNPPQAIINSQKIDQLQISKREYEVLQLIAKGHSNQEIAQQLFISESTVKTHVSKLLQKLDAKRRTQAVKIAKEFQII